MDGQVLSADQDAVDHVDAAFAGKGTVHERFARAFAKVGAIAKGQQNAHHKYRYRGIDDVMNALHGVLAEQELFYLPRCVGQAYEEWTTKNGSRQQVARLDYCLDFYAPDGSMLTVGPVIGQSADTDDKAPMQALSQAAKYALLQAFCIPTEDVTDPDSRAPMSEDGGRAARRVYATEWAAALDALEADTRERVAAVYAESNGDTPIDRLSPEIAEQWIDYAKGAA